MGRKIWLLIILLLLPLQVKAADTGSISLRMKYDSLPVSGGTVTLYEITQWGCDPSWDAAELAAYAAENQIPGICQEIDANGETVFDGLEMGQYLLVQTIPAEGYYPMEPFLVGLPLSFNGESITDVSAEPKMKRVPSSEQLPQTGQLHWPVWLLGGIGIVFMAAGIGLRRKD